MSDLTWTPLKAGDSVDLICTSSATKGVDLEKIRSIMSEATGLNMRTKYCNAVQTNNMGYANSVGIVADDLIGAIEDPESKAIWCIRGGAGSNRLWRCIEDAGINPVKVKPIIGFSDVTSVMEMVHCRLNWPMIHGVMGMTSQEIGAVCEPLANKEESLMGVAKILMDPKASDISYSDLEAMNMSAINLSSEIEGQICGGNLSVVCSGVGTPYGLSAKNAAGKIFAFEDVRESIHTLDRDFHQLYNAGIIQQFAAIIIGDFDQLREVTDQGVQKEIFYVISSWCDLLDPLKIPVFRMEGFGHGDRNVPIPMYTNAKIHAVENRRILSVKTGASPSKTG